MSSAGKQKMGVRDLRAQLAANSKPVRARQPDLRAPPQRPKQKDKTDEMAEKAEKMAMIHHHTSLLKSKPKNDRSKPYREKQKSGILLQLLIVIALAGGGAYLLDPSLAASIDLQPVKDWIDIQIASFD